MRYLLWFLFFTVTVLAQSPQVQWHKGYGTDSDSAGSDKFKPNNFGFLKWK